MWIGGLVTLAVIVFPTALKTWGRGPETKRLMDAVQRQLSPLVYVSIVGLAVTGALLYLNLALGLLVLLLSGFSAALGAGVEEGTGMNTERPSESIRHPE